MVLYLLIRNFKIFTKVISVKITKTAKQLVKYKLFFNANTETSDDKRRLLSQKHLKNNKIKRLFHFYN